MAYQPLEQLLPKSNFSIYRLVRMASLRATELADGAPKLVESLPDEKTTTIALEEIRQAKVVLTEAADKFKPASTDNPAEEQA
jgi:DNA-directed RNA polymerase omega subunit